MATSSGERNPVELLAEEFAARLRRGERPALGEYTAQYPQYADQIRELFPALAMMEQLKPAGGDLTGPCGGQGPVQGPPLECLGDYRIVREVGRGGMGIVYEAVQVSLGRHVAVKVLLGHVLLDPRHLLRFQREAKAAARLHHTNIVPVYGVGEEHGLHYYVMQFIQGLGMDEVLAELRRLRGLKGPPAANGATRNTPSQAAKEVSAADVAQSLLSGRFSAGPASGGRQPPDSDASSPVAASREPELPCSPAADAPPADSSIHLPGQPAQSTLSESGRPYWQSVARVGVQVAEALAYASSQGILHRDIKPSNLLLDTQGTIWVTDFGLAKAADSEDLTHTGDIVGTLRYMAPERFGGPCDVRSDIYALGLTLYELLTLRPAFQETDRNKLLHQVMHEEPPRPRKLNPQVPGDLETIVLKATARDSAQRYQSPGELADDLKRFIDFRPIRARRVSVVEKLWRWCRRNPVVAGLTAAVALLLVVLAFGGVTAAVMYGGIAEQERQARQDAEEKKRELETNLYFTRIDLAHRELTARLANPERAEELLDLCPPDRRGWEWHYLKRLWRVEPVVLRDPGNDEFNSVAFGPDGQHLAAACRDKTVKVWDLKTGPVLTLRGHEKAVYSVAFSPTDGRRLATASLDQTVRVWDLTTRTEIFAPLPGRETFVVGTAQSVTFSPDGCWLAAISEGDSVRVWDATTGHLRHTLPGHELMACLAFSPDGRLLASGNGFGKVRIWDAQTGCCLFTLTREHIHPVGALAFSPDGRHLAAGCFNECIDIWDATTGGWLRTLSRHAGVVLGLAFSPDGGRLASASSDRSVRIWDVSTGQEVLQLRDHTDLCHGLAFSPDGRLLASASRDRTIRLWDATPLTGKEGRELLTFRKPKDQVWSLAISPDGRRIASAGQDATVYVWDAKTGQVTQTFSDMTQVVFSMAFSPDGHRLAAAGVDDVPPSILKVWDVRTGKCVLAHRESRQVYCIAFSPDGRWLGLGIQDGSVKLWDMWTGQAISLVGKHDGEVRGLAFRHDGQRLASASLDRTVKVWDVTRAWLPGNGLCTPAGCIAIFPLSAAVQLQLASWMESVGPQPLLRLPRDAGFWGVAYSPDGRRLLTACVDGQLTLREAETGQPIRTVGGQFSGLGHGSSAAFSPDGRWVASTADDCTVKLLDAATLVAIHSLRGHTAPCRSVAFSPDGRRLVSASQDKTVKVWDLSDLAKSLK